MSSASSLTILHVLAPAVTGGLERVVETLARGQHGRGHHVVVGAILTPGILPPPFLERLRTDGVRVNVMEIGGRAYRIEAREIGALCRKVQPHIVHTHGYRSDLLDAWAAQRTGFSTVSTVHGFTRSDWKNQAYQILQRLSARRFDAVVAVARPIAQRLARYGMPESRLHVVPNAFPGGYDILPPAESRTLLGIPAVPYRIGWVGRITHDKGLDIFLDALHQISDLEWRASIVGDGPRAESARLHARAIGIHGRLDWHGAMPDAGRLMRAFDAFAISSRTEGTPIVLFEAMAAGVPVVATAVGGIPDVVTSKEAVIVPPRDPTELAAALRRLVQNDTSAAERVRSAHERLERYALGPWLDQYDRIYASIVNDPRRSRRMRQLR
jgi:glycosyltransferase involved in cell wall biosynthesis